jgi:capsular polysaccharide biosynthesis protein
MQADPASPDQPGAGEPGALRRWCARFWPWIVAGVAVAVVALIELGAGRISPMYESTGTYIVRPRTDTPTSSIQATANLNDTAQIDKTFARIAESDLIVDRAWASLGSDGSTISDEVHASVTPSANILSISARTSQESVARDLATAVGAETARYIDDLDELYELTVLDPPTDPSPSSSTDLAPGELLAAGLVGLVLGAATHRLARRQLLAGQDAEEEPALDTGIGNERYTHQRIQEERARTTSNGLPFHVLVLQPSDPGHQLSAPAMARAVAPLLREEDRLGHLDQTEPGTFVVIAPGRTDEEAEQLATRLRAAATDRLSRYYGKDAAADVHSCKYKDRFNGGGRAAELVAAL